ncbi:hypothetical protein ncot_00515 [Nocardioides sp. JQ2195]|uniref:hypothetical protein n=1 Tax=Nocardioides sp. JQ2195 TaxID=2592334 RepID=UPI00143EA7A5|nr:hypothetical protein [Nocardioides sp. JQ2195]QIX25234.1 hypothetical protein ncot_00515 [Nocardioides sp. JQ2195]
MGVDRAGSARAWAWVDHLRAGGSTPWSDFDGTAAGRPEALPGAAQLELARRLNLLAGAASPQQSRLVDHVLDQGGPGRGQLDLALVGVDTDSDFGAPPVDPAQVPASELLRIAVGLLADLVVRHPAPPAATQRPARIRPWRRDYRLAGDPLAVDALRRSLLRAGHPPGLRAPVAAVLADELCAMLSDVWSWRILQGGTVRWARWLDDWERQDALPPRLQLPRVAAQQATTIGRAGVHVVVNAETASVAALLGVPASAVEATTRLSPDAVELVRQANLVLRVLAPKEERARIVETGLVPLLADARGPQRAVLPRHLDWVRRQAEGMRKELTAAGYPVRGDLDALVPPEHVPGTRPTSGGVLDVALCTLLRFKEKAL